MSLQSLLVIIKVCHKITLDHRMYMVVVSSAIELKTIIIT